MPVGVLLCRKSAWIRHYQDRAQQAEPQIDTWYLACEEPGQMPSQVDVVVLVRPSTATRITVQLLLELHGCLGQVRWRDLQHTPTAPSITITRQSFTALPSPRKDTAAYQEALDFAIGHLLAHPLASTEQVRAAGIRAQFRQDGTDFRGISSKVWHDACSLARQECGISPRAGHRPVAIDAERLRALRAARETPPPQVMPLGAMEIVESTPLSDGRLKLVVILGARS